MYNGKARAYVSRILYESIPNSLGVMLTNCLRKVILWKSWLRGERQDLQRVAVYDIVNAGNSHQFTVLGKYPMIAHNCCQSGGHDILVIFLSILKTNLRAAGIEYRWYIPDLHDETLYCVRKAQLDSALKVHYDSVVELNEMLDGLTYQLCDPKVINSLAERKD